MKVLSPVDKCVYLSLILALVGVVPGGLPCARAEGQGARGGGEVVYPDLSEYPVLKDLVDKTVCNWKPTSVVRKSFPYLDQVLDQLIDYQPFLSPMIEHQLATTHFCLTEGNLTKLPEKEMKIVTMVIDEKTGAVVAIRLGNDIFADAKIVRKMQNEVGAYFLIHEMFHGLIPLETVQRDLKLRSMVYRISKLNEDPLEPKDFEYLLERNGVQVPLGFGAAGERAPFKSREVYQFVFKNGDGLSPDDQVRIAFGIENLIGGYTEAWRRLSRLKQEARLAYSAAVQAGDLAQVERWLDLGIRIEAIAVPEEYLDGALMANQPEIFEHLLSLPGFKVKGVVHVKSEDRYLPTNDYTLLQKAVILSKVRFVKALIARSEVDLNVGEVFDRRLGRISVFYSPLGIAIGNKNEESFDLLWNHPRFNRSKVQDYLRYAVSWGTEAMVKTLTEAAKEISAALVTDVILKNPASPRLPDLVAKMKESINFRSTPAPYPEDEVIQIQWTPVLAAIRAGRKDLLEVLLARETPNLVLCPDCKDGPQGDALLLMREHPEIISLFASREDLKPNLTYPQFYQAQKGPATTLLQHAIQYGKQALFEELLKFPGIDVNQGKIQYREGKTPSKTSPLNDALYYEREEMIRALLQVPGLDLTSPAHVSLPPDNEMSFDQYTPLMVVITGISHKTGRFSTIPNADIKNPARISRLVQILDASPSIDLSVKSGLKSETVMQFAERSKQTTVVKILAEYAKRQRKK